MVIFHKIFVLICVIIFVEAHIAIDIDDAELKSIGELLVETYLRQNLYKCTAVQNMLFKESKTFQ